MSDLEDELFRAAGANPVPAPSKKRGRDAADSDISDDDGEEEREAGGEEESSEEDSEDEDMLPSDQEDLFEDKEDRRRVMQMNELQREMELTKRQERRDRERERKELLRAAHPPPQEAEGGASPPREKKEVRTSSRQKNVTSKTKDRESALDRLKKMRKTKKAALRLEDSDEDMSEPEPEKDDDYRAEAADAVEDDDVPDEPADELQDDVASENEDDEAPRAYSPDSGYQEEDREDEAGDDELRAMQVRRHKLEKWVTQPFFKDALKNCLVRLASGERRDERTGDLRPHYVLAEVTDVEMKEEKVYRFGNTRTNYFLVVRIGDRDKRTDMTLVSNSGFTHDELREWHNTIVNGSRPAICKAAADKVKAQLRDADNYKYTHADVKAMVNAKRERSGLSKNITAEKARLLRMLKATQMQAATDEEAREKAGALMKQLEELQAKSVTRASMNKRADYSSLNQRNRGHNFVLLNASNRPENEKEAVGLDPFSRRNTAPTICWKTSSNPNDGKASDSEGSALKTHARDQPKAMHFDPNVGMQAAAERIDLSVDLTQAERSAARGSLARMLLGARWTLTTDKLSSSQDVAAKATLTLTDYRRKAGY